MLNIDGNLIEYCEDKSSHSPDTDCNKYFINIRVILYNFIKRSGNKAGKNKIKTTTLPSVWQTRSQAR